MRMGKFTEAREEIQRAIAMTQNLREQELLRERLKPLMDTDRRHNKLHHNMIARVGDSG